MQIVLSVVHLFLAIGLIGLVLIQHGKGADAGAAFGSGASATVFGARGSGSFLSRATAVLATLFFLTSMALAYFASQVGEPQGLMEDVEVLPAPAPAKVEQDQPAVPDVGVGEVNDVPVGATAPPAPTGGVPQIPAPEVDQPEGAPVPVPVPVPEVPAPADPGAQQ